MGPLQNIFVFFMLSFSRPDAPLILLFHLLLGITAGLIGLNFLDCP